jgi:hypothetical protein
VPVHTGLAVSSCEGMYLNQAWSGNRNQYEADSDEQEDICLHANPSARISFRLSAKEKPAG